MMLGFVLWPGLAVRRTDLAVRAQSLVKNPGFEGPAWHTQSVGTSVSSWLGVDWHPWSVLGDEIHNREVEYKLITLETSNSSDLRSHVRTGKHSQQFFTNGASHTAGFYQKVQVPPNSQLTFTIWVQIQSGQDLIYVDGRYVSDLRGGGGNYYAQAGIDPTGAEPAHFGAPLPGSVQWSEPMWDISAHGKDEAGNPADLWVPLTVSARAQGGWVTLYTQGKCKFPTKYNSSFWDDANVAVVQPPTSTPRPPTSTPALTNTAEPTNTALPTATAEPTLPPAPTETATATQTPSPTHTPTVTLTPTVTYTPSPTCTSEPATTATPTVITQLVRVTPRVLYPTATLPPVPTFTATPASGLLAGSRLAGQIGQIVVASVLIFVALAAGLIIGRRLASGRSSSAGQDEPGGPGKPA
jgi:hypothetical protein